uniref:Uncharacterized protein n=1 Tax=Rhizophagus irregularis (strain DAOM 181602 / DAOM 197198 / MUCL 43194) TaxID=747089 RepID=U9TDG4_RHIID
MIKLNEMFFTYIPIKTKCVEFVLYLCSRGLIAKGLEDMIALFHVSWLIKLGVK